jgi:hypothetical protein
MPFQIYIIAVPKPENNDHCWAVWQRWKEDNFDVPISIGEFVRDWKELTKEKLVDTKIKAVEGEKLRFAGTIKVDNNRHFFWFPDNLPEKFLKDVPLVDSNKNEHTISNGFKTKESTEEWGEFWKRSANLHKGPLKKGIPNPTDKCRIWLNPMVILLDLNAKESNSKLELIEEFLDEKLFEVRLVPIWQRDEKKRYFCRETLRQFYPPNIESPSIVQKIIFKMLGGKKQKTEYFDILDRLGGHFYVPNFGSGELVTIQFCQPEYITKTAKIIGKYVAKKIGIRWNENATIKDFVKPYEYREDTEIKCEEVQEFIKKVSEKTEIPEDEKLKLKKRSEVNEFVYRYVMPRSPLYFEFPEGEFSQEKNKEDYNEHVKNRYVCDLFRSIPTGGVTFLQFLLSSFKEKEKNYWADTQWNQYWHYNWYHALFLSDANCKFKLNEGSAKLGQFRLGFSRLGASENFHEQFKYYWGFAPVVF